MQRASPRHARQAFPVVRLVGALVGSVLLVGSVGAGVGVAEPTSQPTAATAAPSYTWIVKNNTDQLLSGEFYRQNHDDTSQIVFLDPQSPLGVENSLSTQQVLGFYDWWFTYTWGRVCYRHLWWNLPRKSWNHASGSADDVHLFPLPGPGTLGASVGPVVVELTPTDPC